MYQLADQSDTRRQIYTDHRLRSSLQPRQRHVVDTHVVDIRQRLRLSLKYVQK